MGLRDELTQRFGPTEFAGPGTGEHEPIVENDQDRIAGGAPSEGRSVAVVKAQRQASSLSTDVSAINFMIAYTDNRLCVALLM